MDSRPASSATGKAASATSAEPTVSERPLSSTMAPVVAITEPIIQASVMARLTEMPSEIAVVGSSATAVSVSPARVRLKNHDSPSVANKVITAPITSDDGKIMSPTISGAAGSSAGNERSAGPHTTRTMPRIKITRPIVTITMENTDSPTSRSKNSRSMSQP